MKFSIGDHVKIKQTEIIGTIHQCEKREMIDRSGSYVIERYFVKTNKTTFPEWYHVSELEHVAVDEKVENIIDKMLIDVHLKYKQYNTVKGIIERKNKDND